MATVIVGQISTNEFLQLQTGLSPNDDPNIIGMNYPHRNGYDLSDIQCTLLENDYTPPQFWAEYYMVDGAPVLRPTMSCSIDKVTVTADGVDYVTISGAPSGADILVDGVSQGTADGSAVELTFDTTGQYVVDIALEPYITWTVTIDAS